MTMINGNLKTRDSIDGGLDTRFSMSGNMTAGVGGTSDYNELENKPSIDGVTLEGNVSGFDIGIYPPVNYSTTPQNTFIRWIDGKYIWKKTYVYNTIAGAGFQLISNDMLSYVDRLIKHETFAYYHYGESDFYWYSIPYGLGGHADITYDYTGLFFHVKNDSFPNYVLYCTIYYTMK